MKKERNIISFSEFVLKIIGLVTMTIDHVGLFLARIEGFEHLAEIFRCIGIIAFPLFVFMIVEGVMHTKHYGKYFLRLAALSFLLMVAQIIIYKFFDNSIDFPSPILELLILSLVIYLLNRKDKFSFLSILPAGYLILCFVVQMIENTQAITVTFLPFYLRPDYTIYGLLLAIGIFLSKPLSKLFLSSSENTKYLMDTWYFQFAKNIISSLVIVVVSMIFFAFSKQYIQMSSWKLSSFACFAIVPILFYSGERGYNKKWFQYGSYLYFPLHIVVIYLIFALL